MSTLVESEMRPKGLQPAQGEADLGRWRALVNSNGMKFAALVAQLFLLAIVIKRYNLESPAFVSITMLVFAGFVVHYFLPMAYRLPFFVALSLASIVMVMGPVPAAWLIVLGLALIGLCHLPLPFGVRVALVAGAAVALTAMRAGWLPGIVPLAVWPLLGSMFMFRMVVYMYDMHHGRPPKSVSESLAYFFMLPNVCFPLFPIVDFTAFTRRYFSGDRHDIYMVGVRWIFRGVVHLMIYRILYRTWGISLYEVENAGDFVHYSLWLFLLYLRVSGQFHIIVGMLHLFGFNLPETHHLYYWSHSFTDYWRRINIYWKDFMMKIFFYPLYFRVKGLGPLVALVSSTLIVFVFTWLLHALQWYWLRGSFLWAANDVLFWSILAGLVVVNSLLEMRRGQKRMGAATWRQSAIVGLRTLATFTVICALWSMWTSESLEAWWSMLPALLVAPTASGWLLIAVTVLAIGGGAMLLARYPDGFEWSELSFGGEAAMRCCLTVLLAALSVSAFHPYLGKAGPLIAAAKRGDLSPLEMAEVERGYYENLMDVHRFNGDLYSLYSQRTKEFTETMIEAGIARPLGDLRCWELLPNVKTHYWGANVRTNSLGMSDKEYTVEHPPRVFRMALLGASHEMALGVDPEDTFQAVVEDRLNRECVSKDYDSYEILNFAVAGYFSIPHVWVLRENALRFHPDAVLYSGHARDASRIVYWLVAAHRDGIKFGDPYLEDLMKRLGIDEKTPEPIVRKKLSPHAEELLSWTYRQIVGTCKQNQIPCYFMMLPMLDVNEDDVNMRLAKEAGFVVLDALDAYKGHAPNPLRTVEWDGHPNAAGHRLLAEKVFEIIHSGGVIPNHAHQPKDAGRESATPLRAVGSSVEQKK